MHPVSRAFLPETGVCNSPVLPANSDINIMFCLQSYPDLESIDHVCINPIDLSILVHQMECTVLMFYFYNCKQNITSLSLLVGTTVSTLYNAL